VPCLLGCLAISAPRFVLFLVWLASDYLDVYRTRIWPFLGFLFLPLTTLAYAFAMHYGGMQWTPIGTATVVTAVLVDLGLFRTSSRRREGGTREITVRGEKVG
jgi:apolipoprotein N-acyltransferase